MSILWFRRFLVYFEMYFCRLTTPLWNVATWTTQYAVYHIHYHNIETNYFTATLKHPTEEEWVVSAARPSWEGSRGCQWKIIREEEMVVSVSWNDIGQKNRTHVVRKRPNRQSWMVSLSGRQQDPVLLQASSHSYTIQSYSAVVAVRKTSFRGNRTPNPHSSAAEANRLH